MNELLKTFHICSNDTHSKEITLNIKNQMKNNHHECWLKKSQHHYLFRSYDNIPNKNEKLHNEWLKKGKLSSHIEGYTCAIQEEEINTRYLKLKKIITSTRSADYVNSKMRLCNMYLHHVHPSMRQSISHFPMIKLRLRYL